MKTRILPALGLLFAVTLVGRSIALSSEVEAKAKPSHVKETAHVQKPDGKEENHSKKAQSTPVKNATNTQAQQCITGEVLKSANAKLALLQAREEEIAARESAYNAIEQRLKKQLAVIESARDALTKDVTKRTDIAQRDLIHLTTMYQTMKPKQAAKIFDKMDPKFSAGFLREMKSGTAGLILANMQSAKAYEISLVIATRNAKYREQKSASLP